MSGAGRWRASPAVGLCREDGTTDSLHLYNLVEEQVEALAADFAHLLNATRVRWRRPARRCFPGARPRKRLSSNVELQEGEFEDVRVCRGLLALRSTEPKELQDRLELGEYTGDHEHSVKVLIENLRKLKGAFEPLMSKKDKDIYSVKDKLLRNVQALHVLGQNKDDEVDKLQAEDLVAQEKLHEMGSMLKEKDESIEKLYAENIGLVAVKDFVCIQFEIKEQEVMDYDILLKNEEVLATKATEVAQKLVKENRMMEAKVVDYGNKLLILEDKLKDMRSLVKEIDDEIQELKNRQPEITSVKHKCDSLLGIYPTETSKKHRRDIIGMHIASIQQCKS
ncbi:hypothetical protein ZWY2020_017438, partial [Hordeum vulgare]